MSSGYIIEVDGEAVGVLVEQGSAYAFHASDPRCQPLEGIVFANPLEAERAARKQARIRPSARPQGFSVLGSLGLTSTTP